MKRVVERKNKKRSVDCKQSLVVQATAESLIHSVEVLWEHSGGMEWQLCVDQSSRPGRQRPNRDPGLDDCKEPMG